MNLATEIESLYKKISRDETEDALSRLLLIASQWDLPFRNEILSISNKYYAKKKQLEPGEELEDDFVHQFNLDCLNFLDQIRLDEKLGMKSLNQLIEDLTDARRFAVEIEQQLTKAQKEIRALKMQIKLLEG